MELEALAKALEAPERPLAAVVGGAKVSTKLDLLGNLLQRLSDVELGTVNDPIRFLYSGAHRRRELLPTHTDDVDGTHSRAPPGSGRERRQIDARAKGKGK